MGYKSTVNWPRADWRQQDVAIARELGVSRQAVGLARRRAEAGKAPTAHKRTVATAVARIEAMDTAGLRLRRIAELAGCEEKYAGRIMSQLGKQYKHMPKGNSKYDWGNFPGDWRELTDKQIGEVLGVDDPAVVAQWRIRHGYRKLANHIGWSPGGANPYSASSGYHRIFQRLITEPLVTKADLIEFAVTQMGRPRTAAEASVQVVLSPREGGRNPRGNRSSKGHLYYVIKDAQGRLTVHPRVPPMEQRR